ncbi:hypothetical protein NDU88_000806 [Pleurodeles waltl]|uniref:Uncharacterized protein n=1 Tax=Pleurodeles waltl TaxID=8319 RepID=A0AAV7NAS6_PLEWA|nr:hypothetical protein NDU88_000806 [Pleurodeles waltl]
MVGLGGGGVRRGLRAVLELVTRGIARCAHLVRITDAGLGMGLERCRAYRQQHPNRQSQKSGGAHRIPKPTQEQAEEEKEAAIWAVANLASYRGSDQSLEMDTNDLATDSDMERSTLGEGDLPLVTPQTVDDLI